MESLCEHKQARPVHGELWDAGQGPLLLGEQAVIWGLDPLALAVHFSSRKVHDIRLQEVPHFWMRRARSWSPT